MIIGSRLVIVGLSVALVTCSPAPHGSDGSSPPDAAFGLIAQDPAAYVGVDVGWGGRIINVTHVNGTTELTLIQVPINHLGMLTEEKYSAGRFVARCDRELDRSVYTIGLKMVAFGKVAGSETKPLGLTGSYTYPVVDVNEILVWREDYDGSLKRCWQTMGWDGPYQWRCDGDAP